MDAVFHLPGLFEFYEFYKVFLPIYKEHREFFYDSAFIGSIYGAPADCLWGGGRMGVGESNPEEVLALLNEYDISGRLTFSNSLLTQEHLSDKKCNKLCSIFEESKGQKNGVIVHSELLTQYIGNHYPGLYLVSSTTKVLTDFADLKKELERDEFSYVVADFRLNRYFRGLNSLDQGLKNKVEFLCNECCDVGCTERKECYESVSLKNLGTDFTDHVCTSPKAGECYKFSRAMESPAFIGTEDIVNTYIPMGFCNFKIEGRTLGSAVLLEFLLYYLVKPKYHLRVREIVYLDSMLDLF